MPDEITKYIASKIKDTPLVEQPFDHTVFQDIFPSDYYAEIVGNLPENKGYRNYRHSDAMLPDGTSARLKLDLTADGLWHLPKVTRSFLRDFGKRVTSPEVVDAFRKKFQTVLEAKTGKPLDQIRIHPYPILFRDISGYKISVHPDSHRKAISVQFYLPSDDEQCHLGTLFHETKERGHDLVKKMEFLPNTGYAFGVTPTSYHSLHPMNEKDKPRNSLMIIFYYDRGPLIESLKFIKRKLTFFSHFKR